MSVDVRPLYEIDLAISDVLDQFDNPPGDWQTQQPKDWTGTLDEWAQKRVANWNDHLMTESQILTNMRDEEVRNVLLQAVQAVRNHKAEEEKYKAEKAYFDEKRGYHAMRVEGTRNFIKSMMTRNGLRKADLGKFKLSLTDKTEYEIDSTKLPDKYFERSVKTKDVKEAYKAGLLPGIVTEKVLEAETLNIR